MNLCLRLLMLKLRSKSNGKSSIWETAELQLRVVPTDLDLFLHMNNGKYASIMDIGRIDLLQRAGLWDTVRAKGWLPLVAAQTITYRRSLKPWQRFALRTRYLGADEGWVYHEQTFLSDDELYAYAIVRTRFVKNVGGSVSQQELEALSGPAPATASIPEWVRDWAVASRPQTP